MSCISSSELTASQPSASCPVVSQLTNHILERHVQHVSTYWVDFGGCYEPSFGFHDGFVCSFAMLAIVSVMCPAPSTEWTHVYSEWTMVDVFVFFSDGSGAIGSRVGLRIRRCAGTSQSAGPFWVLALTHIAVSFRTSDDLDYYFWSYLTNLVMLQKTEISWDFKGGKSKAWWCVMSSFRAGKIVKKSIEVKIRFALWSTMI